MPRSLRHQVKRTKNHSKTNNGWDKHSEKICNHQMKICGDFILVYEMMHAKYRKYGDRLNLTSGILGTIITTLNLAMVNQDGSTENVATRIVTSVLSFGIAAIAVLYSVWKIQQVRDNSLSSYVLFKNILDTIVYELSKPARKRLFCDNFMKELQESISIAKAAAPLVDEDIKAIYRSQHTDLIYDPSAQINFVREQENIQESSSPEIAPSVDSNQHVINIVVNSRESTII